MKHTAQQDAHGKGQQHSHQGPFFAAGLLEQGQAGGAAGQVHQAQHRSADRRLPGPSVEGQHLT